MKRMQMAVADVAFTNAKKSLDLNGMVASLIYRSLERNTSGGKVLRFMSPNVLIWWYSWNQIWLMYFYEACQPRDCGA